MILALAVISVVGVVGLFQWNQRLIVIGFVAGATIIAINIVVVTTQRWHRDNIRLDTSYETAEEVVRRRTPRQR